MSTLKSDEIGNRMASASCRNVSPYGFVKILNAIIDGPRLHAVKASATSWLVFHYRHHGVFLHLTFSKFRPLDIANVYDTCARYSTVRRVIEAERPTARMQSL